MLAAIEWDNLLEVIWVSLVSGVAVTAIFSLVIYSGARASEARRAGNPTTAAGFLALAIVAFGLFMAGLIIGVTIMLTK